MKSAVYPKEPSVKAVRDGKVGKVRLGEEVVGSILELELEAVASVTALVLASGANKGVRSNILAELEKLHNVSSSNAGHRVKSISHNLSGRASGVGKSVVPGTQFRIVREKDVRLEKEKRELSGERGASPTLE